MPWFLSTSFSATKSTFLSSFLSTFLSRFCRLFCRVFFRLFCRVFCRLSFFFGIFVGFMWSFFVGFLRLPCTFGGVCSRTDVAAPDYSQIPQTPFQFKAYRTGYSKISLILWKINNRMFLRTLTRRFKSSFESYNQIRF